MSRRSDSKTSLRDSMETRRSPIGVSIVLRGVDLMAAIQTRMYALKACVGMRVMSEGPGSATDVSSGQADGLRMLQTCRTVLKRLL